MSGEPAQAAPTGFHLMLPTGWRRYLVDDEGRRALTAQLAARMKELGRPDLDVQARTLVEAQWRRLRSAKVSAVYLAEGSEAAQALPASIAVRQHVAPVGTDFAASVRTMARVPVEQIETPVGVFLRWITDGQGEGETGEVRTRQVGYAVALPGEGERRGLVFLSSIPHLDDADPTLVALLVEQSDLIMETFRWR
ncbi:hypothetical protein ACFQRL_00665 [Microbacterium fluvii]|uniref:Uncharacterized protein n=1 Tax=Microbacterium fluvii TaxID=415215 RepID=A0ABW2H8X7_9MICO|nr:hypothetical protein [Microbacterium fluvii]MCU4671098.1 hypothetical protein [Microbacterium fluvii]